MSFDYEQARLDALDIISEFGFAAVVFIPGIAGDLDEWGEPTDNTPDVEIFGISTPILSFKTADIDGENIKFGDGYVYFHSDGTPAIDMQIAINSVNYVVRGVKQLTSGENINVFTRLHLRA
jgi:hypothetical protein